MAQKFFSSLSKSRQAEDKVVKAMSTWTEPEEDDSEESSHANLVHSHCSNGVIFYYRELSYQLNFKTSQLLYIVWVKMREPILLSTNSIIYGPA